MMRILDREYHPDYEISSGQRVIREDGARFDFLFPKAAITDKVVSEDGEVKDTLKVIDQVVRTTLSQTAKIASVLKQDTLEDTLRAVWEFLYHNIQYHLDKPGMEELRSPRRSWNDRLKGIDCDCFSIFCSSILCNLGIPHRFRITRYSAAHWQHIYVIVPKASGNAYYTVDAVLGRFNYEKPFTQKMDYNMPLDGIKIAVLDGVEDTSPSVNDTGRIVMNSMQLAAANNTALHAAIFGVDLQGLGILDGEQYLLGAVKDPQIERGLYRYLVATRQAIAENPVASYVAGYNHDEILKMLDYAIQYWFTDKRDQALGQLIANEAMLDQLNGFGNLDGLLSDDELYGDDDILTGEDDYQLGKAKKGKPKKKKKGFFKKVGGAIKKVGKGLMRFNPATIAARNGFLLALKLNIGKMSSRLKWAYATPEQASAKGISANTVAKAKKALEKVEKLFEKIGGKKSNLRKAILAGKKGSLSGLGDLGIIPVAAAVAAATPLITAVIKIMKDSGLAKKDEVIDISSTEGAAVEDDGVSFDDNNTAAALPEARSTALTVMDAGESTTGDEPVDGLGSITTGAVKFAQNNPLLSLAIGGAVMFGVYKLLSADDHKDHAPSTPALSGPSGRHPPGKPKTFHLS
ncbi:hypothetical protein [Rurimicrobium arvi]|uniref:Transglutaminase-like domain-containing protein n=1 Tax=Rurimicrobium arvi TaxID=2049916 RepID=A0ABP8MYV3_9BACT